MLATLFAATESELDVLFPEWLVPRGEPETRQGTNPFTGETMTFVSWLPDGEAVGMSGLEPEPRPGSPALPPVAVEPGSGDAAWRGEASDEDDVPGPLRTLPHLAISDISGVHLDALAAALGVPPTGRPARVAADGTQLDCLDAAAAEALARLDPPAARKLAAALASSEALAGDEALARRLVVSLQALLRAAPADSRICIYCTI